MPTPFADLPRCAGIDRHASRAAAGRAIAASPRLPDATAVRRAYRCPRCGFWHVGVAANHGRDLRSERRLRRLDSRNSGLGYRADFADAEAAGFEQITALPLAALLDVLDGQPAQHSVEHEQDRQQAGDAGHDDVDAERAAAQHVDEQQQQPAQHEDIEP